MHRVHRGRDRGNVYQRRSDSSLAYSFFAKEIGTCVPFFFRWNCVLVEYLLAHHHHHRQHYSFYLSLLSNLDRSDLLRSLLSLFLSLSLTLFLCLSFKICVEWSRLALASLFLFRGVPGLPSSFCGYHSLFLL